MTQKENNKEYLSSAFSTAFDSKLVKAVLCIGVVVGIIYLGKHIMNQSADTIRAYKNLRDACKS